MTPTTPSHASGALLSSPRPAIESSRAFKYTLLKIAIVACGMALPFACNGSASPSHLGVGKEGESNGAVLIAADQQALDMLIKSGLAMDTVGEAKLVASGRAFPVDEHTRLLVIDSSGTTSRVRTLSGPMAGSTGWVWLVAFTAAPAESNGTAEDVVLCTTSIADLSLTTHAALVTRCEHQRAQRRSSARNERSSTTVSWTWRSRNERWRQAAEQ